MQLTRRQLENTVCIACGKTFAGHTKERSKKFNPRVLMTCMLRIQGTLVAEADKKGEVIKT